MVARNPTQAVAWIKVQGTMSPRGKGHEDPEPASVPTLSEPVLVVRRPSVPDRG